MRHRKLVCVGQPGDGVTIRSMSNCGPPLAPHSTRDTSKAASPYDDTTSKSPSTEPTGGGRARHKHTLGVKPTPRKEHPPTIITIGPRE